MKESTKFMVGAATNVIIALVWGEALGGVVSRPIRAWRTKSTEVSALADLIVVMNDRICDLEDQMEEA